MAESEVKSKARAKAAKAETEGSVKTIGSNKSNFGKIFRWVAIILVIIAFIALLAARLSKPVDHSDSVWDEGTTLGNLDAKNYYIDYTDLACPYCDVFSRLIFENEEEFKRDYIEGKDILYEVRMTDFLYEYGSHSVEYSRWGAEGSYCALNEGKFWEYYRNAVLSLYDDYQSKGIASEKGAPSIEGMTIDYWLDIGHEVGLGAEFDSCMREHKMLSKVEENTARAAKQVDGGLPYFKFNKFTTGGFDTNWDWSYVKQYLDAGLK